MARKKVRVIRSWEYKGKIKKEISRPVSPEKAKEIIRVSRGKSGKSWFDIK